MKINIKIIVCFLLSILVKTGFSQNIVLPIQHETGNLYEANLHRKNSNFHTGFKPYASKEIYAIADSIVEELIIPAKNNFSRFAFNENLFEVEEEGEYNITGNLLLGLSTGIASDTAFGMFIRGGRIEGSIGEKVFYSSDIYLGSSVFPDYLTNRNDDTRTFNGNGALRIFNASNGQRQQSTLNATGQVTYQPNKFFQFQLGQGKNFIGDGYRSMLLSDYSTFSPYFKVTTSFWNIQYTNLYTSMIDVRSGLTSQSIYPRKYVTSHHLSWNITPRLNIGLFETVIYQDSSNIRGFDVHYLNPVIFYRPIEFEIGSRGGNALIGFNAKYKITDDIHAYGQFIFDEFSLAKNNRGQGWWGNKYGWQLGVKSFNTIIPNLTVQTEINSATFYTYSHKTPLQNYANSNLALAHPLGANFIESMSIIRYQKDRFTSKFQLMYALQGVDTLGSHWGADINQPYDNREQSFGNKLLQGVKTTTTYADISVGYIINPRSNFHVELGYRYRGIKPEVEIRNLQSTVDSFIYLGFKTNFVNWYYDY
ncbi:MAG: hypothetical protein AB8G11_02800 [Saprospiraceae bacterium]